ncbi:type II toxin-antitoxin system RelE/ParE family toxin [Ideonella sp. YS5]|uniref:type II toxin-antitoxin system RelE/ParE family toxin n=1 Tax=Ideonella sp. YS5 TaxID=3453714 RepID=UPI003EE859F4
MKPAVLRPWALRDQQGEVRYYRKECDARVAVKVAKATNETLDQIELEPGMGSPTLGQLLAFRGFGPGGRQSFRRCGATSLLRTFERRDHLDVVRLLGERQDIAAILGDEFASD